MLGIEGTWNYARPNERDCPSALLTYMRGKLLMHYHPGDKTVQFFCRKTYAAIKNIPTLIVTVKADLFRFSKGDDELFEYDTFRLQIIHETRYGLCGIIMRQHDDQGKARMRDRIGAHPCVGYSRRSQDGDHRRLWHSQRDFGTMMAVAVSCRFEIRLDNRDMLRNRSLWPFIREKSAKYISGFTRERRPMPTGIDAINRFPCPDVCNNRDLRKKRNHEDRRVPSGRARP